MPERIKKTIREQVLDRRNSIPEEQRAQKSRLISTGLMELAAFKQRNNIMLYVAFGSEPDVSLALEYAIDIGKKVFVPDNVSILEVRRCGVFRGNPRGIDLVIVPGIAFDENGHRIGYGGGWYDRFSQKFTPDAVYVGVAFEEQIVESIPRQEHDIQLDFIVTESRLIGCK